MYIAPRVRRKSILPLQMGYDPDKAQSMTDAENAVFFLARKTSVLKALLRLNLVFSSRPYRVIGAGSKSCTEATDRN